MIFRRFNLLNISCVVLDKSVKNPPCKLEKNMRKRPDWLQNPVIAGMHVSTYCIWISGIVCISVQNFVRRTFFSVLKFKIISYIIQLYNHALYYQRFRTRHFFMGFWTPCFFVKLIYLLWQRLLLRYILSFQHNGKTQVSNSCFNVIC